MFFCVSEVVSASGVVEAMAEDKEEFQLFMEEEYGDDVTASCAFSSSPTRISSPSSNTEKAEIIYRLRCLALKLPDGWEIDEAESSDYETFYAPGGDLEVSSDSSILPTITS